MKTLSIYLLCLLSLLSTRSLPAQVPASGVLDCLLPLEEELVGRSGREVAISRYRIDRQALSAFWQSPKRASIRLLLPGRKGKVVLPLKEIDLYGPGFVVQTSEGETFTAPAARFYQYSTPDTLAALAVFPDRIVGQFSWGGDNWTLAPAPDDRQVYRLVPDRALPPAIPGTCHTEDDLTQDLIRRVQRSPRSTVQMRSQLPPLDIYFELDYHLFREQGRSVDRSVQFFMHIFNEVALIFRREGIQVRVKRIKVWTGPAPFNDRSASSALYAFRRYLSREVLEQDWDLAMLVSRYSSEGLLAPNGGLAGRDALCIGSQRQAYANIHDYYETFPAFSWSVFVIAHEIGHVIASPHTHNCYWPGGPIDDCYCPEGKCDLGPPTEERGGTIMSYCYLKKPFSSYCRPLPRDSNPGVDFLLGFGELPGNLLRTTISERSCLQNKLRDSIPNLQFASDATYRIRQDTIDLRGVQIRNTGLFPAGPFSLQLITTESPAFSDTYASRGSFTFPGLPAGDSLFLDTLLVLDTIPAGQLGLWLDPRDTVLEYHEGDNVLWLDRAPKLLSPDLRLETPGQLFDLPAYFAVQDFWIKNRGDTASGEWRIDYYLCRNTLAEPECHYLGYAPVPVLDTGARYRMNLFFFKADLSLPAGEYYLAYDLLDPFGQVESGAWGWFDLQRPVQLGQPRPSFLRSESRPEDLELIWEAGSKILRLEDRKSPASALDVRIWSSLGQLAGTYHFPSGRVGGIRIPLGPLPAGVYWVRIRRGAEVVTKKIWIAW